MAFVKELLAACAAEGYRIDEKAGTASGVASGIAFLARVEPGTIEMSVNIPADHLPKLQAGIAAASPAYAAATVVHHNFGVLLTLPGTDGLSPEEYTALIRIAAVEATKLIGVAYDDKFDRDGEPVSAYIRGFFGALLGAVVGIIPWVLVSSLLHITSWYLGALISVASFYGYCYLRGAHSTRYAVTLIVVFSLGVMVLPGVVTQCIYVMQEGAAFWDALALAFQPQVLISNLASMGFGLLANIAGLLAIKNRVLSYTHEAQFLRRPASRNSDRPPR